MTILPFAVETVAEGVAVAVCDVVVAGTIHAEIRSK